MTILNCWGKNNKKIHVLFIVVHSLKGISINEYIDNNFQLNSVKNLKIDLLSLPDLNSYNDDCPDDALIDLCKKNDFDVIFFTPGSSQQLNHQRGKNGFTVYNNFRSETLSFIRSWGVKVVWKHEDMVFPYWQIIASAYANSVDYFWTTDTNDLKILKNCIDESKLIFLPTSVNAEFFYPEEKKLFIYFSGSISGYNLRPKYIDKLKQTDFNYLVHDTLTDGLLDRKIYCQNLRQSLIGINFCLQGTLDNLFHQLKWRPFEILACKCILLELENDLINQFFTPMKDYVPFVTPDDLIDKIKWIIANPQTAIDIAESGYQKLTQNHTNKIIWNKIFQLLNYELIWHS